MSKTTVVEEADESAVKRAALSKAGAQLLLLVPCARSWARTQHAL